MFQITKAYNSRGEHTHAVNKKEYLQAVYRSKMMTAAELNLEVGYPELHAEVLESMRCVY
jgi:hypothetical protein